MHLGIINRSGSVQNGVLKKNQTSEKDLHPQDNLRPVDEIIAEFGRDAVFQDIGPGFEVRMLQVSV